MKSDQDILFDVSYPDDGLAKWNAGLTSSPSRRFADNVETSYVRYQSEGIDLPVSINEAEYESSYVVSLYTSFVGCVIARFESLSSRAARFFITRLLLSFGAFLKAGRINKIVSIDNRMLSTSLHPPLDPSAVDRITAAFLASHPDHFLIWRSLNWKANGPLMKALLDRGYTMLPIRKILIFHPDTAFWKRTDSKNDLQKLKTSPFAVVSHEQFRPDEFGRVKRLYDMLYLEKHHSRNAAFTETFFETAWRERWLTFVGLRDPQTQELVAWGAYYMVNGVMTPPVLGYDTGRPLEDGLFRQLTALFMQVTQRTGWWYHASAGVTRFKLTRGALPLTEYYAVFMKHLPMRRRFVMRFLQIAALGMNVLRMKYLED